MVVAAKSCDPLAEEAAVWITSILLPIVVRSLPPQSQPPVRRRASSGLSWLTMEFAVECASEAVVAEVLKVAGVEKGTNWSACPD